MIYGAFSPGIHLFFVGGEDGMIPGRLFIFGYIDGIILSLVPRIE